MVGTSSNPAVTTWALSSSRRADARPLRHTCTMAPRVMICGDPVPAAAGGRLRHPGTARKQIWRGSGDSPSEHSPWLGAG